jgi:serine/threonine protein kinase, bacterial
VTPKGIITTVAGSDEGGYSGDGGPATNAQLNIPAGVAIGPDGNLYIADAENNRIRMVALRR